MENKSSPKLGEFLRSEREKKNVTIEQIASATKINIKLLHALESDSFDSLPAKPFVRGFITNYARYLGLEPGHIIEQYDRYLDEQAGVKFKRPAEAPHIFVDRGGNTDNSKTVLGFVMGGFLLFGFIAVAILRPSMKHHHSHKSHKLAQIDNDEMYTVALPPGEGTTILPETTKPSHEQPNVVAAAPPAPTPKAQPSPAPTPTPAPAHVSVAPNPSPIVAVAPEAKVKQNSAALAPIPAPLKPVAESKKAPEAQKAPPIPANEVKFKLVVRAKEDSWVKYQSDDRPVLGFILKKDKTIYIKARNNIRFMTGNPKGIEYAPEGNGSFQSFKDNNRSVIIPASAQAEFQEHPFR